MGLICDEFKMFLCGNQCKYFELGFLAYCKFSIENSICTKEKNFSVEFSNQNIKKVFCMQRQRFYFYHLAADSLLRVEFAELNIFLRNISLTWSISSFLSRKGLEEVLFRPGSEEVHILSLFWTGNATAAVCYAPGGEVAVSNTRWSGKRPVYQTW
jgi:hypothetical protein